MSIIHYGRHNITPHDIDAVVEVLRSEYLTQGPKIAEFEQAFSEYIGVKYAVAVSNGTAALHLGALALNVKPGDKVITTPITFAATANCVLYAGGEVVFADINAETYLLDIKEVEKLLTNSPKGTYAGIIPVDFAGRPVDMEAYRRLADEYDCWIIEDACHAPGGYFRDSKGKIQNCGNDFYSDLAIFSFHPVKHLTCGEGGMITTNNESLYKKLLLLRTHGITRELDLMTENHGGWYYEMKELGFNYRLCDFQAALGLSQLKRADNNLELRRNLAFSYDAAFASQPFIKGHSGFLDGHAYHLYIVEIENRNELYNYLRDHNIYTQVHYIPLHLMPYYRKFGWQRGSFPVAEEYYSKCLSLPMFPTLTAKEQEYVIRTIESYYKK